MVQAYNNPPGRPPTIIVMGVSGSGKSTVASLLAERLSLPMLEGDSLHSAENIRRMEASTPLTDLDRLEWLDAIAKRIAEAVNKRLGLVVSCSALKRSYRDMLRHADPHLLLVYLAGSKTLIEQRMSLRRDHFMPPILLDSQLQLLEEPTADEHPIRCDIGQDPRRIVSSVISLLTPS